MKFIVFIVFNQSYEQANVCIYMICIMINYDEFVFMFCIVHKVYFVLHNIVYAMHRLGSTYNHTDTYSIIYHSEGNHSTIDIRILIQ